MLVRALGLFWQAWPASGGQVSRAHGEGSGGSEGKETRVTIEAFREGVLFAGSHWSYPRKDGGRLVIWAVGSGFYFQTREGGVVGSGTHERAEEKLFHMYWEQGK